MDDYIYVVVHLEYTEGAVYTKAVCAYRNKQEAIESAKKLNKCSANSGLAVYKKRRWNHIDHYFVEAIPVI